MEFPYPILEELFRVLMIRAIGVNYPREGIDPTPFSAEHPSPTGHLLTGMISKPHVPPSVVEWVWMTMPPMGTLDAPALVFSPPLAVAPASIAHALVVDRGSQRRQRSPV